MDHLYTRNCDVNLNVLSTTQSDMMNPCCVSRHDRMTFEIVNCQIVKFHLIQFVIDFRNIHNRIWSPRIVREHVCMSLRIQFNHQNLFCSPQRCSSCNESRNQLSLQSVFKKSNTWPPRFFHVKNATVVIHVLEIMKTKARRSLIQESLFCKNEKMSNLLNS